MKYTIENDGIHLIIETAFDADYPALPEIPISEAVEACHKIRDKQDAALCECEAQGAPTKCGCCNG